MGRGRDLGAQPVGGDVADVAVAGALHPGPALGLVVDVDRLAVEQLAVQRGVVAGAAAQVEHPAGDLAALAFDIAIGPDPILQVGGGQVVTKGIEARVEAGHGSGVGSARGFCDGRTLAQPPADGEPLGAS